MTIRKGTNIVIGQVPTDTSITSTGIYPVTGAAIYTALGLKANNTSVVHLAGTETIIGAKTIQNNTLYFKDPTNTIGTFSSDTWFNGQIRFLDSAGTKVARLQPKFVSGTNIVQMGMYAGNSVENGITVNGTGETSAPMQAATNSTTSNGIATTGWVNDPTKSTNVVHRSGDETISGLKTFTSNIKITGIDATSGIEGVRNFEVYDTNGSRVGLLRVQKNSENRRYVSLNVCSNTNANIGGLSVSCAADGTDLVCNLPANTYGTNFHGTADYAKWADLAECYKPDEKYSVGTLIKFGGEKDITIANDKCNGVISDKPGFVLDAELEDSQPVALVGKTPIRIIGKVKKFDKIVLSEIPGVGRVLQENEDKHVIARALESNDTFEEKLVMCVTKFNLD